MSEYRNGRGGRRGGSSFDGGARGSRSGDRPAGRGARGEFSGGKGGYEGRQGRGSTFAKGGYESRQGKGSSFGKNGYEGRREGGSFAKGGYEGRQGRGSSFGKGGYEGRREGFQGGSKPGYEGKGKFAPGGFGGKRPASREGFSSGRGSAPASYRSAPRPSARPNPNFGGRPAPMPRPSFEERPAPMPRPDFEGRPAPMPRPDIGGRAPRPRFGNEASRPPRFSRAPMPPSPAPQYSGDAEPENLIVGRNPIREAIRAGKAIEKLLIARGLTGSAVEIIAKARDAGIVIQEVDRARLDGIYPNHQGMIAYGSAAEYLELDELMAIPAEKGEEPFFVALDSVTDPHNLGAILRSAACAGAHGVIVPERRAAGLVPAAVKAAAGALEHIGVAKVGNLRNALDKLKENGIWITGAASDGEDADGADLTGPICLVIGSEGDGIGPLIRSTCDRLVSLPMSNGMESLNASVAAGILLYDIRRARGAK